MSDALTVGGTAFFEPSDACLEDTASLGGFIVPGIVKVEADPGRKIEVKSGPGVDGATTTDKGYQPPKITMSITMWTDAHRTTWEVIEAAVAPKPGKGASKAVSLGHVRANKRGIVAVVVESVSLPVTDNQITKVSVKMTQWMPAKKSTVTNPKNSGDLSSLQPSVSNALLPKVGPPTPPTANPKNAGPGVLRRALGRYRSRWLALGAPGWRLAR